MNYLKIIRVLKEDRGKVVKLNILDLIFKYSETKLKKSKVSNQILF